MLAGVVSALLAAGSAGAALPVDPPSKSARRDAWPHQAIEWTAYANDVGGTKDSFAAEITRDNVSKLAPGAGFSTAARMRHRS